MSQRITTSEIVEWAKKEIRMKEDWIKTHGAKWPQEATDAKERSRVALITIVNDFGRERLDPSVRMPKVGDLIEWCRDMRADLRDWIDRRPKNWPEDDIDAKRHGRLVLGEILSRYKDAIEQRKSKA